MPMLVGIPLLAGGGQSLVQALSSSMVKASIALSTIAFIGRFILNRIFFIVAGSKSQEAFLSLILLTVTPLRNALTIAASDSTSGVRGIYSQVRHSPAAARSATPKHRRL